MGGEVPEMTTFTTEDRIAMQSSMNANKPVGNMCLGCGSSWSDERLEIERRLRPNLISCCPDRKVVPVYTHPADLTYEDLETIAEALLMIGFSDAFINYHLKEKALGILGKALGK